MACLYTCTIQNILKRVVLVCVLIHVGVHKMCQICIKREGRIMICLFIRKFDSYIAIFCFLTLKLFYLFWNHYGILTQKINSRILTPFIWPRGCLLANSLRIRIFRRILWTSYNPNSILRDWANVASLSCSPQSPDIIAPLDKGKLIDC